jgi:exodeoxyribonuclease VII small subunit
MSETQRPIEELGFEEARAELESIVAAIDDGDIDIDTLSAQVARAGALLLHCRDRIIATRTQVESIVADIDQAWGTNGSAAQPEEPF